MSQYQQEDVTALILAGGQARRMGGVDKGLVQLNQQAMIEHILAIITPQTNQIIINANRNHDQYSLYGYPVINDELADYQGPLAGMLSGLRSCETRLMITMPCDSPFIPYNLTERLLESVNADDSDISVAHDGNRLQPVFCLLKTSLIDSLDQYLARGERKIDRWFSEHNYSTVDFADQPETFSNINNPEELKKAEQQLKLKQQN